MAPVKKSIRSQSVAPETIPINKKVLELSNYMNYRLSLDGSVSTFLFYCLIDYTYISLCSVFCALNKIEL